MLSISSSLIEQVNTKYEAYRLVHDPTRLMSLLFSKYGDIEEDLYILYANQVLYNLHSKFNCIYKEHIYSNITRDFLKRLYNYNEALLRIPKLSEYYKNYHLFFCRPTLRHRVLGKIVGNYQDRKAEVFYKNNYKESKDNTSNIKNIKKEKNSNSSMTSLDNLTNNKTIFDKYTKKILDKSETEIKNNNYYNTLLLETSRSNLVMSNGLISKRAGGEKSFEKCISGLLDYQYIKGKNKNNNIKKKVKKEFLINNKQMKNILFNNSTKFSKIKYIESQSQRLSCKLCDFKMKKNYSKILSNKKRKINSSNTSLNNNNYIIKNNTKTNSKKKINSLYILPNNYNSNRYSTSTNALLKNKSIRKINNIKELHLKNIPITTTNKESKKIKNTIYKNKNNNTTMYNTGNNSKCELNAISANNIHSNSNIVKNLKLGNNNNKKLSKLSEYLKHMKSKENIILSQKTSLRKKNTSIGEIENKNELFDTNNKKRITKKRIILNKNLKMTITNSNIDKNTFKSKSNHTKNKTYDFNIINQNHIQSQKNNNNIIKISNCNTNNVINNDEYNTLLLNKKKQKKDLYKIIIENSNFLNNKSKTKSKNNNTKSNKNIFSPSIKKSIKKICVTQKSSKEKNIKKKLTDNRFQNNKMKFCNFVKYLNSPNSKTNKSLFTSDAIKFKDSLIKTNKKNKSNYCLSPNFIDDNNSNNNFIIPKNVVNHTSPSNKIIYLKRNITCNNNKNNNIYIKKSITKDNKIIAEKSENMIKSCNYNYDSRKEFNNIYDSHNHIEHKDSTSNNSENKNELRNKNKHSYSNINNNYNSRKSNMLIKKKSSINNKPLNKNYIINNHINLNNENSKNRSGNINISIEKNNINIKDSILHIDKIYIKKDNSKIKRKKKDNKKKLIYDNGINKRDFEIKIGEDIINTVGNDIKLKSENISSTESSPFKMNNSVKAINVHRNFNLITKNNKEIKKKNNYYY